MDDKTAISLSQEQRDLLLKYEPYFADSDLFRLISVALKKGEKFEISLDDGQIEDLLDQICELANSEDDQKLQNKLEDLLNHMEYFYDGFGEDKYSEHSNYTGSVTTLKIFLAGSKKIWRKIAIRQGQTLHDLHNIIFEAFDRYDEHMYSFFFPHKQTKFNIRRIYDSSDEYSHPYACENAGPFGTGAQDASKTAIESLNLVESQIFFYLFDFGDDWWHEIKVEMTDGSADDEKYPRIVERKGESPEQYPDNDEDW